MSRAPRLYHAHPRHPLTGKQFRVSARTPRELEAYLHRIEGLREELRLGMRSSDDVDSAVRRLIHGAVTFERATRSYTEREGLAPNTARRVRSFLASSAAPLALRELDELSAPVVSAWLDRLTASGAAKSSIGVAWRTLRAIVRFAILEGWIGRSPWGSWRPVLRGGRVRASREAARDVGELESLLASARILGPPDLETKIACAALLGLRQGELAGLRWSDVDPGARTVTIARQYDDRPTKQRAASTLEAPQLFAFLDAQRARLSDAGLYDPRGPIFPDPHASARAGRARAYAKGEVLTTRNLRAAVERAGLPNASRWSPHSLRDSFVTLESRSPMHAGDLSSLAERSRHASPGSLVRYLRSRTRSAPPAGFELTGAAALPLLPPHK